MTTGSPSDMPSFPDAPGPPAAAAPRPAFQGMSPAKIANRNVIGRVVFGIATLALFLLTLFWWEFGDLWGPGISALLAYSFFALHVAIGGRRLSAFDPVVWVPVSMLLFYFGMPVSVELLATEPVTYDAWRAGISPSIGRGFATLLMGLVAFCWGTHLAGLEDRSHPKPPGHSDLVYATPAMILMLGSIAMIAAGIAIVGPSVVFGYYDEWWAAKQAGADQRFIDMGLFFAMAGIFAALASDDPNQRLRRYFAFAVAAALAFIMIQKGDRSGLIGLGVGAGWCYTQRIRRVRPVYALAGAAVALLLLPVLKEFRDTKALTEASATSARDLLSASFYEMGSSANAMVYSLDLIPAEADYVYGLTYADALLQAIPNVTLSKGKSFVLFGVGGGSNIRVSPSAWITSVINPVWWENGGGYGYAMVAEFYYNFGLPSIPFGMAVLGWLLAKVRNSSNRSALWLVASALLLGAMAFYVRNVIGVPLKFATWPLIGLIVIRGAVKLVSGPPRGGPLPEPLGGISEAPDVQSWH